MSFEAVPCMFKGRAEDGNEASMFGLLIRPAASTAQQVNSSGTTSISSSAPSVSSAISIPSTSGAIPVTGTAIQIVPSSHNQTGNSATAVLPKTQAKLCTPPPIASTSAKSHHSSRGRTSTSAQSTSTSSHSGMIPISPKVSLPAPKLLPSTSSAMHHHSHFTANNSLTPAILQPQFVQIQPINLPWTATSHYPSSTATLIPYNAGHGINTVSAMHATTSTAYTMQPMHQHVHHEYDPRNDTNMAENGKGPLARAKTGFESPSPSQVVPQMLHGQTQAHCVESGQSDPITTATTSSAYMSSQASKPVTFTPSHCSPSLKQIHGKSGEDIPLSRTGQAHGHNLAHEDSREGSEELGDLNSIDYTQLVAANSAIITTEDYLQGGSHSTLTFSHNTANHNIPGDMCPQTTSQVGVTQQIGIHIDDQHNAAFNNRAGENGRPQEGSSLLQKAQYPQFRYMDHTNGNAIGRQNHQQQQQTGSTSAWHNPSAAAHHPSPYMGPNQGQPSSFTPDSGIDSGSPPSISSYTPPMVSPYTTQVTSECASNGQYPLSILNMSVASNSSVNTIKSGSNGEENFDDYSDMPTLLPAVVDHESQRENTVDRDDLDYNNMTPPAIMDSTAPTMSPPSVLDCHHQVGQKSSPDSDKQGKLQGETTIDKAAGQQSLKELFAVTPTMDLHELAERLASSIDLEQLSQLTSLIQSKAASTNKFKESTNAGAAKETDANDSSCLEKVGNTEDVVEKYREDSPPPECTIQDMDTSDDEQSPDEKPEIDEVTRCRISVYRRQVREKLNQKLRSLVESLDTTFDRVDLDMGPRMKFALPWQHLDWPSVRRRISNKNPLEFGASSRPLTECQNTSQLNMDKESSKSRRKRKRSKDSPTKAPKIVSDTELSDSEQSSVKSKRRKSSVNGLVKKESSMKPRQKFRIAQGFAKIRSNVLLEPPALVQYQPSNCECPAEKPCTSNSNCPHRADRVECSPSTCSLSSSQCQNRRIANNETPDHLEIYQTPNTGWGVRTLEPLKQGQFVCEYVGEVMKTSTYLRRYASIKEKQCRYGIEFVPGYVMDATKKGNVARFFNHSCEEYNCEVQRWLVNGQCRVGIFTLKNIPAGEELTYHYGHGQFIALEPPQKCKCNLTKSSNNETHFIPAMVSRKKRKVRESSEESAKRNSEQVKETTKTTRTANNHKMPVFLARNVRKSKLAKKHLTLKIKSIPELAKSLLDSQPEQRKVLRLLMELLKDFSLFCLKRENVPRRRISYLQKMVKAAFCADFLKVIHKRNVANEPSEKLTGALIERLDGTIKDFLALLQLIYDRRRFEAIKSQYIHLKKTHSNDLLRYSPNLSKDLMQTFLDDRKRGNSLTHKKDAVKILTAEADLSYMDSPNPVGSFNPDRASKLTLSDNKDEDCVRCICGIMEDDGVMTQCDSCHFWMHADCLDFDINSKKEFICEFCTRGLEFTPNVNIVLNPQPQIKFRGCNYYRTLVNSRGIQVRVNEAVYVERLINDEHKQILKKLHEECAKSGTSPIKKNVESEKSSKYVNTPKKSKRDGDSKGREKNGTHEESDNKRVPNVWWEPPAKGILKGEFHRRDLRTFRVERIFTGPNGQPFVFGVYYARPHETFCDSTRMFYKNELFWTPLFDTLPLDSVVGRCLILEPQVWASGRPKSPKYLEEDVFICEYQIDKHQRCFEKILPKNRYFINTESYVFDYYPEKLPLRRDFTPFILPSRAEKSDSKPKLPQSLAINPLTKDMNKQNLESICSRIQASNNSN